MDEELKRAYETIAAGGIILYPTDTVWGIGCDATNPEAVEKIYALKQRSDSKSMLMLVASENEIPRYIDDMPDIAWQLIDAADTPLTIVYDGAKNIASNLIASDGSVGIRVTHDDFSKKLCGKLRRPLVSTSANISGKPAPASFCDIDSDIIEGVDYVVDWRRDETIKVKPSSIIKLCADGTFKILRK